MGRKLLYATTNLGKIREARLLLSEYGLSFLTLTDLGIDYEASENEETIEENAQKKASEYLPHIPKGYVVFADDTGLFIDALGGEPGRHVRRWKNGKTKMSDREIIAYCLEQLTGVRQGKRTARFVSAIAVASYGSQSEVFTARFDGVIAEHYNERYLMEGFPFEGLFYVPAWKAFLGERFFVTPSVRKHYLTHREKAIEKAIPRIKALLGV